MAAKNLVEFEVATLRRQIEQAWKPHHKNSSNYQCESYQVYKSLGATQPHTAEYLRMRKELKKEFPTQGGTTTNKEGKLHLYHEIRKNTLLRATLLR